ncbi:MAG: M24 family metallopeptidase [Promethearchaeota archaeon]
MSLEKINKIRSHKKFGKVDTILLTKPENITYILGFSIESDTYIMIPREHISDRIWVFLNALEYDQAKKNIDKDKDLSKSVEIKQIPIGKPKFVEKSIKELNLKSIGFEDDYISVKKYNELKQMSIPNFIGISEIINHARIIKTKKEIERMQKAAELGDIGFKTIIKVIEEGKTEKELAAEAEYMMRKSGSDGISFNTIVASGEHSAYPHAKTSDKKIEVGDMIIIDIGAKYNGYCSDMTRTFIFGKNKSKEKENLINFVNEGQQYALDNIKAGVMCKDIDKITRDFFRKKDKKLSSRFIHSLGHGIGINIHEEPYLNSISEHILKEDMVVTVEPGLYLPGLGGARTEDQIVIKSEGFKALTHSKKYYY